MIKVSNVSKKFKVDNEEIYALDNVSIDVPDGGIYGIIGLSGAGKSTLLRCLSSLEKPDSGEVIIDNENINNLNKKDLRKFRSKIGVVFQGYNLLMQRNAYENVAFPLKIRKTPKDEISKIVHDLFKLVNLEKKEKAYPSKLSGGEKQRVAIARSLATNPSFLLLDEPTSALDPITTKQILSLIKEINVKYNMTIIIITHEIAVVKNICDKVAVLNLGKIVEVGDVDEVFENPSNEITRLLLGKELIK